MLHWQDAGFELPLEVLTVDGYRATGGVTRAIARGNAEALGLVPA